MIILVTHFSNSATAVLLMACQEILCMIIDPLRLILDVLFVLLSKASIGLIIAQFFIETS